MLRWAARMSGRVVSVNVGLPRLVAWRGRQVSTGIFKSPVDHPLQVRQLNIDGDGQADLSVHGGPDKAIYAYPVEHYAWWQAELGISELQWGQFGENLTTSGLLDRERQKARMRRNRQRRRSARVPLHHPDTDLMPGLAGWGSGSFETPTSIRPRATARTARAACRTSMRTCG